MSKEGRGWFIKRRWRPVSLQRYKGFLVGLEVFERLVRSSSMGYCPLLMKKILTKPCNLLKILVNPWICRAL